MLIDSPRITPQDRQLWDEWLAADEFHSKTAGYKRRVELTRQIIKTFLGKSRQRYFVALSWGKDSTVLAHMFLEADCRPLHIYVRNMAREPEGNVAVRDAFLQRFSINYDERQYNYADADETYFDTLGRPHKWQNILADLQCQHGCHVTGIRYDESAKRRRRFRVHGIETDNSFAPFRYMTVQDIFAYLLEHDLPTHPNYAMTGGGRWDKYKIRVAAVGNREGDGIGRAEWEREYYSDLLNRLSARLE